MKTKSKVYLLLCSILLILLCLTSSVFAKSLTEGMENKIWFTENGEYSAAETDLKLQSAQEPEVEATATLPVQYDLRDVNGKNYVTPVEFQNPWGCCWSFGALSAAETNALLNGAPNTTNLSERALAYYTGILQGGKDQTPSQYEGTFYTCNFPAITPKLPFNSGGSSGSAISELSTWNGASTEAEAPYQNNQGIMTESPIPGVPIYSQEGTWSLPYEDIYDDAYRLQNSQVVDTDRDYSVSNVQSYTNRTKQVILNDGGVLLTFGIYNGTDYYNDKTNAQYTSEPLDPDHGVCIVGWDDNYSVNNFNPANRPPANGAWICKNNWSSSWGDEGYFYLSYYDQTIIRFSSFDIELPDNFTYDNNLQYDYLGDRNDIATSVTTNFSNQSNALGLSPSNIKFANIFTADTPQRLDAVSAYLSIDANATITTQVYLLNEGYTSPENGQLVSSQTDTTNAAGYYTLTLDTPVNLSTGQVFSVVQNVIYSNVKLANGTVANLPGFQMEFGIKDPKLSRVNMLDQHILENQYFRTNPSPGHSFVYGVNEAALEGGAPIWEDVTSEDVQQSLAMAVQDFGDNHITTRAVPGSVMIKAFTTDMTDVQVPATDISVNNGQTNVYLATEGDGAINSQVLEATLAPEDSTDPIVWSVQDDNIASLSSTSGNSVTVSAVNTGITEIDVTAGSATASLRVIVSNNDTVADSVLATSTDPDYFTVTVNNLIPNPAINTEGKSIQKVSIFTWSDPNQSDMDAKVATQIPNTNDWQWENFSVNDNEVNNFYNNADQIQINVYASTDANSDGNLIATGSYDWLSPENSKGSVAYIGYSQNLGFDKPTVFDGATAGTTNDLTLEGLRVSSSVPGVQIGTQVHIQDIGWVNFVEDGDYAGTMHRNLGLEAVVLNLSGEQAPNYNLQYRVYQKGRGWQDWVGQNQQAGSVGENVQITAIEIKLEPVS